MEITIKRAYEPYSHTDGWRVLVDRLWPRGLAKARAHIDDWQKELAPSRALRLWFNHDSNKWDEFQARYKSELEHNDKNLALFLAAIDNKPKITLIYSAHDNQHNNALVLQNFLKVKLGLY